VNRRRSNARPATIGAFLAVLLRGAVVSLDAVPTLALWVARGLGLPPGKVVDLRADSSASGPVASEASAGSAL